MKTIFPLTVCAVSALMFQAFTAAQVPDLVGGPMGQERIAPSIGTPSPYTSEKFKDGVPLWLQIDLGQSYPVSAVKLYPFWDDDVAFWWDNRAKADHKGYPLRFKIEVDDNPDFAAPKVIADLTADDHIVRLPLNIETFRPKNELTGRYVRLTVTKPNPNTNSLILWRFEVISGNQDVAVGKTLSDSVRGHLGQHILLRPQRPVGEGIVFDHPEQVTDPATWKPVKAPLRTPRSGVTVGGLFGQTMDRNIHYLQTSFSDHDLAHNFRQRAGKNPGKRDRDFGEKHYWTAQLGGSIAGRFLMGVGNTLRWKDNAELRRRMDTLVDAVEECAEANGYIFGFPERRILTTEGNSYCRSWITQGLIEAGIAGNPKCWTLLRRGGDWFNSCPYLPEMLLRCRIGNQGMIANSRTYVDTPVGVPADIQVLQRYFQLNFWLEQLSARNPSALWQYPYERTHSYLIVTMSAYMDMYAATGDKRYLEAMRGAWDILHGHFLHIGGSISLLESFGFSQHQYPPDSYLLRAKTGELCGNAFWVTFNEQLRVLFPEEEKYVTEIEKSIYNICIANQVSNGNMRYHAILLGKKENGTNIGTCCEGQGTRLYGALPEFIYKIAGNGIYVDLFNESAIKWKQGDNELSLQMHTEFPEKPEVTLKFSLQKETKSKIRLRIPSWAQTPMSVSVNGKESITGNRGTYVTLDRIWKDGDEIRLTLPMEFRLTKYAGTEKEFCGKEAYALEYGPILMALTGNVQKGLADIPFSSAELREKLKAVEGKPLHFAIEGTSYVYKPYYVVESEQFTCYPFLLNPVR